jgi:signal transduction histidine kinase
MPHGDDREELAKAKRAVDERDAFFEAAAHDLRSPLTVIMLQLEAILFEQSRLPERTVRQLNIVKAQVDHLARLAERLTDVIKIESGTLEVERERFDLAGVAAEIVERFEPQLRWVGCTLQLRAQKPVAIVADRLRIDEAVGNLVSNACKYAAGTPIDIDVERSGGRAILCVADRGPGIPRELRSAVFEKFARGETGSVTGLGLGLWISRRIIEAHGGVLSVDERPGGGARFVVDLPAEAT